MYITIPEVSEYLSKLYKAPTEELNELRLLCEERHIPIIMRDAEELILNYIRLKKPANILEIGTAVGYSSICFATVWQNCKVTTLELRETSFNEAKENFEKFKLEDRIEVILGDARVSLKTLQKEVNQGIRPFYDMIFIDAAKGHYQEFWDESVKILKEEGIIISDNILYKAITASEKFLSSRRNGTIMRRMRSYLDNITNIENVKTCVLPVGDGLAISQFL